MARIMLIALFSVLNIFSADYFPLQKGNYWVYTGNDTSGGYLKIKRECIDELKSPSETTFVFNTLYFDSLDNVKAEVKDTLKRNLLALFTPAYLSLDTLIPLIRYINEATYYRTDTINGFVFLGKQYSRVIKRSYLGDEYIDPNAANVYDVFIDGIGWINRNAASAKHPNLVSYSLIEWKTQFSEFKTSTIFPYIPNTGKRIQIKCVRNNSYHGFSIDLLGRAMYLSQSHQVPSSGIIVIDQYGNRAKKISVR